MKKGILFLILFFLVVCKGTGQILQGYVKTLEEKPVSQAPVSYTHLTLPTKRIV